MIPPTALVLADDLTGANDAGVQFAGAGIRAIVLVGADVDRLPCEYPVVVINTESRHISPEKAADRVRKLVELGLNAGVQVFYKKTDSTLRGNIGAELEALARAAGASVIPFVPALPDLGRTTRGGVHYLDGVPIAETAFSRDPLNPIRYSHIADVLSTQTDLPVTSIRAGALPLGGFRGIVVPDCENDQDLRAIASAFARMPVLSGSVALMKYLPDHLPFQSTPPDSPEPLLPILLVNGSLSEHALEQISVGGSHFSKVRLTPEQLVGGRADLVIPAGGGNLLLASIVTRSELDAFSRLGRDRGMTHTELHLRVAQRMGRLVNEILAAGVFRTVVVFGGDTLAGIAHANRWRSLAPLAELEPGVSVSVPGGTDLTLISKAGGFGDADVVNRIVGFVNGQKER